MSVIRSGTTAFVTGATGFIGRRLCARLRGSGASVIGLARRASPRAAAAPVDAWVEGDLGDDAPLSLPKGIDTVFHLAGKAHALSEVAQDDAEYARINTEGTRRMLEAAKEAGVRAFVFFSTVKAVGEGPRTENGGPRTEVGFSSRASATQNAAAETVLATRFASGWDTPYGQSKRAAERLVLEGGYVPHPVVLRPSLIYGPSPKGNLEKMITAVRRGRFPPLPETGNRRSMVHVDDVIDAALVVARSPAAAGGTYIVADNEPFSTRQLFEWISEAVGQPVPRWSVPMWTMCVLGRVGDLIGRLRGRRFVFDSDALEKLTDSAWYSSEKLQRELGWVPRHTLRGSLGEICAGMETAGVGSAVRSAVNKARETVS
jgi:UDP-glucose 4-epimerase